MRGSAAATKLIDRRIALLFAAFAGLLAFAALRAAYLGTVKAPSLKRAAISQQVAVVDVPARRGTITDRHGVDLAVSEPAEDVAADPLLIKQPLTVARQLAPILGQPEQQLLEQLTDRHHGFVYLRRAFPSVSARPLEKLNIPGIELIPSSRRIYPQKFLASQLLGFVGIDGGGLTGLEYSEDRVLHGHDGERRIVKDALGQPISLQDEHAMRAGRSLQLTLDSSIQDQTEKVLGEVGQSFSPKGAMALVMDPRTGELLALANWPRVDANDPSGAPDYAKQDRAVQAAYEPGSTFKPFTVSAALEQGVVTPDTQFNLPPVIQVADRTIHEAEGRSGYETLSTAQILAQSSNVGAVTIGLRLGAPAFDRWVRRFGFGRATRSDLPAEGTGIVPSLARYSGSSMGNLPIGQGLAVTPLQMATAYAAIANGGILRPAHVVRGVDGKATRLPRGRRIMSAATAASVRTMLEGVLAAGGTASEVSIPGYQLAGKTGTAQKPDPKTGGYSDTKYVASFVGFAPAKDPKLLVAVMVDEPQGEHLGGLVAAPAVQQIMQFVLPYLRIPPS
ncbi:MAG: penicillin-binding protein 2 [Actinobacteria bacterium]|nr:MAG: penicillin-binding protein 2 [Actinomycetota bacterium]